MSSLGPVTPYGLSEADAINGFIFRSPRHFNSVSYPFSSAPFKTSSTSVADNELCRMVARAAQGINVCEETLPIDIIEKMGPGGYYVT